MLFIKNFVGMDIKHIRSARPGVSLNRNIGA